MVINVCHTDQPLSQKNAFQQGQWKRETLYFPDPTILFYVYY